MPSRKPVHTVLQLKIDLEEVEPAVWRRLMVPGDASLATLHRMLQAAMGWNDSHLHGFEVGDRSYGPEDDEDDDPPEDQFDEAATSVLQAIDAAGVDEFLYEYDFGDRWSHRIVVEGRATQDAAMTIAVCLGGAQACPPDDVGGPDGYEEFLAALSDPKHEEHADYVAWVGGSFDPTRFDPAEVDTALQWIR
jgi:hypothetical protein